MMNRIATNKVQEVSTLAWLVLWRELYTLSYTGRFYCVSSYLTKKLNKLCSFDSQ